VKNLILGILNVIHPEGHALQEVIYEKIRTATTMAGVGGAGGQGHVRLRSIVPV